MFVTTGESIMKQSIDTDTKVSCYHCGEPCREGDPTEGDLRFCCEGCRMVYLLLSAHGLDAYYSVEDMVGINRSKSVSEEDFGFLDDPMVLHHFSSFRNEGIVKISLDIPQIHCSACIWLLEHIDRLNPGIRSCRVNFLKKKASIVFDESQINLRSIVELLDRIGYGPRLNLKSLVQSKDASERLTDKKLIYQIGVAGFCFGNIMLLSFPEYLGVVRADWVRILSYINIFLSIPLLFYSGRDYLISAYKSLYARVIGIDIPIAIGMLTLFLRSIYEILSHTGDGYLDSLGGFIFFLLVGRWFQQYTFQHISFDHDYRSFFPIAVAKLEGDSWTSTAVDKVQQGDVIRIKHQGVIPCDGYIEDGVGYVDYSFVTGESRPVTLSTDQEVYAGGKQCGGAIQLRVTKEADRGYLTQLWQEEIFGDPSATHTSVFINQIGKYFTLFILLVSLGTLIYWWSIDRDIAFQSFTAVLIVACPCVLALAIPFIYGNVIRLLSHDGIYCKNTAVIERLTEVDRVVFDKTGTITDTRSSDVQYEGTPLSEEDKSIIFTLASQSYHPLSRAIVDNFHETPLLRIDNFKEEVGRGTGGMIAGREVRLGSSSFILDTDTEIDQTTVLIEIDGRVLGRYHFDNPIRPNMSSILGKLADRNLRVDLLSGDNAHELEQMEALFPSDSELLFNQSPQDKLNYIQSLREQGAIVMMVGDGLNDAGALKQSDVGVVIAQDDQFFSPACDIILSINSFAEFDRLFGFVNRARWVLYGAFAFAAFYNVIGLWFAVQGKLSPIVAAILMPASSISVILYGLLSTTLLYKFYSVKSGDRA